MVVSSPDPEIRKQAKAAIKACCLFQKGGAFAHFAVISKVTPPDQLHEPQPTMGGDDQVFKPGGSEGSSQEDIQDLGTTLHLYASRTGDNYLCRPIRAVQRLPGKGPQTQSATAGPLILLDGISHQLTVEHIVDFDRHQSNAAWQHANDDDDWDDDDDDSDYHSSGRIALFHFDMMHETNEGSVSSEESGVSVHSATPESDSSRVPERAAPPPLQDPPAQSLPGRRGRRAYRRSGRVRRSRPDGPRLSCTKGFEDLLPGKAGKLCPSFIHTHEDIS